MNIDSSPFRPGQPIPFEFFVGRIGQWPHLFGHEIVDVKKVFCSFGLTYD